MENVALAAGRIGGRFAEARGGIMERAAAEMGLVPLLSFGLTAGEGAAAALAVQTVRTAVSLHLSLPPRHSMGL